MVSKKIFLCDDTIDGIFTAIYQAWSSKYGHANIKIEEKAGRNQYSNMELFSEYIPVETNNDLAVKVSETIKVKLKEEAFQMVCHVALSNYYGKADLIYRFLILGFAAGTGIMEHLSNEVVCKMHQVSKYVFNEAHHLFGFVRFSEQDNGVLMSVIHPNNNVLAILAPHFADRLPREHFIIWDKNRDNAVLHAPGRPWIMVDASILNTMDLDDGHIEDEYTDLWKIFFKHIAIEDRINPKLQRNNLPLRFRKDITEFYLS